MSRHVLVIFFLTATYFIPAIVVCIPVSHGTILLVYIEYGQNFPRFQHKIKLLFVEHALHCAAAWLVISPVLLMAASVRGRSSVMPCLD